MIKPPFTVLILKDSHHPVTIRITRRFVLSLCITIPLVMGLAIYGTLWYVKNSTVRYTQSSIEEKSSIPDYVLLETTNSTDTESRAVPEPNVKEMTIQQSSDNEVKIAFSFQHIPGKQDLYAWIIVNPDSKTAGDMIIYPRSPLFRGLPVDYRNGIRYNLSDKNRITTAFSGSMLGVGFKQFRILAYSLEGTIIIDKHFTIEQNVRM